MEIYRDIAQNSDEWHRLRAGVPTASEFAKVCAKKGPRGGTSHKEYVGRTKYMWRLAGEILTGEPEETYSNADMERGHEREAEARDLYAVMFDAQPEQVGFIRNGNCGCSPDSLLDDDGLLEIKDTKPSVQIERLENATLPSEHKYQVHGQIMVAERERCMYMSHCRRLPPLIIPVYRDEQIIAEIREAVDRFCEELDLLVERIKKMW